MEAKQPKRQERRIIGTLVLYSKSAFKKLAVFRSNEGSNEWSLPTEEINESNDSHSVVLGLARHISSLVDGQFVPEMLDKPIELPSKIVPPATRWMNRSFHEWIEELSESMFMTLLKEKEAVKHDIYFREITNEDAFMKNMKNLRIEVKLITQEELLESSLISRSTRAILETQFTPRHPNQRSAQIDFDEIIKQKEAQLRAQNSKSNTVILMIHKEAPTKDQLKFDQLHGSPRVPTKGLFMGIMRQQHEKWLTYYPSSKILPSNEILATAKAIVMSGSQHSAYDSHSWILNYKEYLRRAYSNFPHLKFLGICFGEQLFATVLNGVCEETEQRALNGSYFNRDVQRIRFTEKFMTIPFVKKLSLPKRDYCIQKSHGDIVSQTDPANKLQIVGSSDLYKIELLVDSYAQDCRFFGMQGHPEYAGLWQIGYRSDFARQNYEGTLKANMQEYLKGSPTDHFVFRDLCISFLNP